MPTLLESAELPVPDFCEGLSLLSECRNKSQSPIRAFLHGEHSPGLKREESWQFIIRENDKYIWDARSGSEWYFDLASDPLEKKNRINDKKHSSQISECRSHLVDVLKHREDDDLVEQGKLKPGKALPSCRPELLQPHLDYDEKTRTVASHNWISH